ncbi:MAG: 2-amino-4-hydroxy-6-hydroxymethyldihydropteridine diphosphokinase [Candidatus Cryptobacteroides sp.]
MELYLSIGSDSGDRERNLRAAVAALDSIFGTEGKVLSDIIETEPWGFESSTKFLNAAVKYDVDVPRGTSPEDKAMEILDEIQSIEESLGRKKHESMYDPDGKRIYFSRTIDIDIIFFGNIFMNTERLKIPHPLAENRDFVMIPIGQIASDSLIEDFPWVKPYLPFPIK